MSWWVLSVVLARFLRGSGRCKWEARLCAEAMVRVGEGGWRWRINKTLFKMLLLLSPL